VGIAFQIWDDVLDLIADEEKLGKPVGSDIRKGKKTLIVSHFFQNASEEDKAEFLKVFGKYAGDAKGDALIHDEKVKEEVAKAIELLRKYGSIEYAVRQEPREGSQRGAQGSPGERGEEGFGAFSGVPRREGVLMGEFRVFDHSLDITLFSFAVLLLAALAVPWLEISIGGVGDAIRYLVLPWFLVVPLHEGLHLAVIKHLGARVSFGFKASLRGLVLAPYLRVETPLKAGDYVKILLAPAVLSIVALALAWLLRSDFWALVYVFNTAGMAGDIVTLLVIARIPPDTTVFDRGETLVFDADDPDYRGVLMAVRVLSIAVLFLFISRFRVEVVVKYE